MKSQDKWEFWIDRGGTFTDIVARDPEGEIHIHKLLSENFTEYKDAPVQGIKDIMKIKANRTIPVGQIEEIKMGTTVATNALLERNGERTVLVTTQGFGDILKIGYQNRPDIFALNIKLPEMLYEEVIEVRERFSADGRKIIPLEKDTLEKLKNDLIKVFQNGIKSCAIVLLHGYKFPEHEQLVVEIAEEIGFSHISVSHQVSPLQKIVSRGDTTVADAYLSPILKKYIKNFTDELTQQKPGSDKNMEPINKKILFMQSNGGLINADNFQGKDSILSGPAGGIVGAVQVCKEVGFNKIITFDMGGTSTDVAHYNGEYEREYETRISGVRLRVPMLSIHTVAAGGGSILHYDGYRYLVGPDSAGADPGPACYRRGGPLTVTDCNVMTGRIIADYFPNVFGEKGNQSIDRNIVLAKFQKLALNISEDTGQTLKPEKVAAGFLDIAVENMANAVKKVSLEKGYDISNYVLCCFGGAGGQHACQIADRLGMKSILIHPYAGVLSAYGMGLADLRVVKQQAVDQKLTQQSLDELEKTIAYLKEEGRVELSKDNDAKAAKTGKESKADKERKASKESHKILSKVKLHLKYSGSDFTITVDYKEDIQILIRQFREKHLQLYGFNYHDKEIMIESLSVEIIKHEGQNIKKMYAKRPADQKLQAKEKSKIFLEDHWQTVPVYLREDLYPGDNISGPALIIEKTGTNLILRNWQGQINSLGYLIIEKNTAVKQPEKPNKKTQDYLFNVEQKDNPLNEEQKDNSLERLTKADPVLLEIFNKLLQSIAEQMGVVLQKTAFSVNIKERLDFSCAVFNHQGDLVANAPHIPVHLGSMSESVKSLIANKSAEMQAGDVYVANNPFSGGTHLPDVTVITPFFIKEFEYPILYVASRGHHADIGGITPGSMPPFSKNIHEEGILLDNIKLVEKGEILEDKISDILTSGKFPVRNLSQNMIDIKAQIAANNRGVRELQKMMEQYGVNCVLNYMQYIQDNAEMVVRNTIMKLKGGEYYCQLDTGEKITAKIKIDHINKEAVIDFTGTSKQVKGNFNAPSAVTKAAVLYVIRCLVEDDIPLNDGCLRPIKLIIPEGSLLNPVYPAAVVAGNVEISQLIVDTLFAALGIMAAAQGTMNNLTFGNDSYQYYETICGGSGGGNGYSGTDSVQTHMTNSRLTDPEILESRYPVLLEEFKIRKNSGGEGEYPGGNGVIRKIKFLETMTAAILSGRRKYQPFGLSGGKPGLSGENIVVRKDGSREILDGTAETTMARGDALIIKTPGGGAFGRKTSH